MCLVVCFMLLLVVCCHLANKDIYINRLAECSATSENGKTFFRRTYTVAFLSSSGLYRMDSPDCLLYF